MTENGAAGMKAILEAGGRTLAQDEGSSVVYGMPRQAYLRGGVGKVAALQAIPHDILALVGDLVRIVNRLAVLGLQRLRPSGEPGPASSLTRLLTGATNRIDKQPASEGA
jgi:hypothetical protein